ncbi:MAG TPA: carboxy terminal-processing peptidase [Verrucomicrobiae bacterium]|jgi:carboxyl-terminal processing protease
MRLRFLFAANRAALALASAVFSLALNAHASPQGPEPKSAAEMAAAADPYDPIVAQIAAERISDWNYSQHPFDQEISSKFLDQYIDSLDYFHMFFIQSDIKDFEKYRTNLNVLTLRDKDLTPCWVIFSRFMERVHQRMNLTSNMLNSATFVFTNNDRFVLNRHDLPYAKDLNQAMDFWHEEVRCEYLEQLLTSPDVQFTGRVSADGKGRPVVTFKRDKLHPANFDLLPGKLLAKDGHEVGAVEIAAGQSNATVRLDLPAPAMAAKVTNLIYSATGQELGDVTFHHEKQEAASTNSDEIQKPRNNDEPAAMQAETGTNLMAVIHLERKDMAEIHKTLTNRCSQLLSHYKDMEKDGLAFERYVTSLARAYDPHSDFMSHISAENFAIQMKLSLFGIGALLGKDNDYCKIVELKEGPAKKSGKIHQDDRIVAVAQSNAEPVEVEGMTLDQIVEMIRGPKGSQVTLTVIPGDAPDASTRKHVTLVRDEIKLEDQEVKSRIFESPGPDGAESRVGVINIPSFYADNDNASLAGGAAKSMTSDVEKLIVRMKKEKVGGIILDLRNNGGGFLEEAIRLTGLFVPAGPVVQTKEPSGEIAVEPCHDDRVLYDGPLIVLTSRLSASASEITAGALQDWNRALIVGDHSTFGKGTVQTMQSLRPFLRQYLKQNKLAYNPDYDPGQLKITIKKFYRAAGVSTQLQGVLSDIELPSRLNADTNDIGESALPNALPCDKVESANPENLNRVRPYVAELKERSRQRVAASKDFDYIKEDIAQFLKMRADKSLSLNLDGRKAEQKSLIARADAIKKERLSRKKLDEKVYDLTLQNADMARLQLAAIKPGAASASTDPGFDDDSDTEAVTEEAAVDPALDEARHIMIDYIALANKEEGLSKAGIR